MSRKRNICLIFGIILFSFFWLRVDSQAALVAHWTFDEGSGTQVVDTVGGLVGNLSGSGATLVSGGRAGGALSLDKGSGGYVTMGDVLRLGTGPYSFVVWVKTSSTEATTVVISKQQDGIPPGYHISINENGAYGLPGKAWLYNYFPAYSPVSITSVNDGLWHQIVGVRGNNQVKIYVDGFPVEGSQPDQGLDNPIPGTPFLVGGYPFGGNPVGTYTGLIDDIQVYNHMLSDQEVQWLYDHPGWILCTSAPSGMASWWKAEGNASDFIGNNNGTWVNGPGYASGKVGQAFRFNGVDNYVQGAKGITSVTEFSFSFWINITSFTHPWYMAPICQSQTQPGTDNLGFCFATGNDSRDFGIFGGWKDGIIFDLRTPIPFGTGVWKHIAVTYDGTMLQQYLDGVLNNQAEYPGKILGNDQPFVIGQGKGFPGGVEQTAYFHGLVDEVAMVNRALTADEIAAIYNAGSGGLCAVKTIYLPLILKN